MAMIKPKFASFHMEIESMLVKPTKSHKPAFGKGPETYDPIDVGIAELIEFDGEDDHVHLQVTYPPKVALSSLVNSLKGISSRLIRKKELSFDPEKTLGRSTLVAKLFCWKLRRNTDLCLATVYRI